MRFHKDRIQNRNGELKTENKFNIKNNYIQCAFTKIECKIEMVS